MNKFIQDEGGTMENSQLIENALLELIQDQRKRDAKAFKPIELPLTLENTLTRLTKPELQSICKSWSIPIKSTLKKQEIISKMLLASENRIPFILNFLNTATYKTLKKVASNKGVLLADKVSVMEREGLMTYGLLFPGILQNDNVVFMPEELVQLFLQNDGVQFKKIIDRNMEWITFTQGFAHVYGAIHMQDAHKEMERLYNTSISLADYSNVITFHAECIDDSLFEMSNVEMIVHVDLEDSSRIIKEQLIRSSYSYLPLTKKQLLQYEANGYVDITPAYKALHHYIQINFSIDQEDIQYAIMDIVNVIKNDATTEQLVSVVSDMFELDSFQELDKMMQFVTNLHNHTNLWVLKGHTPTSIVQSDDFLSNVVDLTSNEKVGRNDPCTCGSGKKFKKCCGR